MAGTHIQGSSKKQYNGNSGLTTRRKKRKSSSNVSMGNGSKKLQSDNRRSKEMERNNAKYEKKKENPRDVPSFFQSALTFIRNKSTDIQIFVPRRITGLYLGAVL